MICLTPRLLISAASALLGLGTPPQEPPVSGAIARLPRAKSSARGESLGERWDVRFVQYCGFWSHYDYESRTSSWPLRGLRTATELALFGMRWDALVGEPEEGDLFVQRSAFRKTFVHAGIVLGLRHAGRRGGNDYFDVATIEGDTDHAGRIGGGSVMTLERRLGPASGDLFLRWADVEFITRRIVHPALYGTAAAAREAC